MLCENCGKNEANVTYTENINGNIRKLYLCSECGEKMGIGNFNFSTDFNSLLSNFLTHVNTEELPSFGQDELQCKRCGYTYDDFAKKGKFGCSQCYQSFTEQLEDVLKRIHGSNRHVGKQLKQDESVGAPEHTGSPASSACLPLQAEIYNLNQKLKQAIVEENYEEAAKIRDEIKKLEKEGK